MPLSNSIKTVANIRTNTNRTDQINKPHLAYLRIGSLEMERERKLTEKRSILERVKKIDDRCKEIDNEKARLLKSIGENKDKNLVTDSTTDIKTIVSKATEIPPIIPEEEIMEQEDQNLEPEIEEHKVEPKIEDQRTVNHQNNNKGFKIRY